jgi:flagellar biosynthesis/type III secretory pathway M-ring protein FliF/YscJ
MTATVRVPRSYFVKVYKEQNPKATDPDEATLQPSVDAELKRIRADVKLCTNLTDDKSVAVETYFDTVLAASEAPVVAANSGVGVTGMVGGHAKEIALGVLAVVSLFMMSTMVKKGAPVPVLISEPEPERPKGKLTSGEEVVGEAGDGETILGGMELDEDAAKTQQMLGQVSDLVKENPDAAANLIKRWMNK